MGDSNLHARPCSGEDHPPETEQDSQIRIEDRIEPENREFYRNALMTMKKAEIPMLVGGAFAFEHYTGISRYTKDLDIFIRAADVERVLAAFDDAGYKTELTAPHWLAKACANGIFVDFIFGQANGAIELDDKWFDHSVQQSILGLAVDLCPPEELIWSKAFVMDRERFDGADVAHLILATHQTLDWNRLLLRFDDHWQVLLSHLLLFTFIYPSERGRIPGQVLRELLSRLDQEFRKRPSSERICRGTLLSMFQYQIDILRWGYEDPRVIRRSR